jgi:hypothetical protein
VSAEEKPPRSKWWRALMFGAYAVLAAVEFVIGKAKDWVAEQIWGGDEDDEEKEKDK